MPLQLNQWRWQLPAPLSPRTLSLSCCCMGRGLCTAALLCSAVLWAGRWPSCGTGSWRCCCGVCPAGGMGQGWGRLPHARWAAGRRPQRERRKLCALALLIEVDGWYTGSSTSSVPGSTRVLNTPLHLFKHKTAWHTQAQGACSLRLVLEHTPAFRQAESAAEGRWMYRCSSWMWEVLFKIYEQPALHSCKGFIKIKFIQLMHVDKMYIKVLLKRMLYVTCV